MRTPHHPGTMVGRDTTDGTSPSYHRAIRDQIITVIAIDDVLDALRRDDPIDAKDAVDIVRRELARATDHLKALVAWRGEVAA